MKETTSVLLARARQTLEQAKEQLGLGQYNRAVGYSYHAAYHATSAALHEAGEGVRSYPALHARFNELFVRTRRIGSQHRLELAALHQSRQEALYDPSRVFTVEQAEDAVDRTRVFVEAIEVMLQGMADYGRNGTFVRIPFELNRAGNVVIKIFDRDKREVTTLVNDYLEAGDHTAVWYCGDVPRGQYWARLQLGPQILTREIVLEPLAPE